MKHTIQLLSSLNFRIKKIFNLARKPLIELYSFNETSNLFQIAQPLILKDFCPLDVLTLNLTCKSDCCLVLFYLFFNSDNKVHIYELQYKDYK